MRGLMITLIACCLGGLLPARAAVDIALLQQANTLTAQGQYAEAVPCWTELLKASPDAPQSAGWRYYLGVCLINTPRMPEGIVMLEAVPTDSPFYGDALVQLFTLHLRSGEEERAEAIRRRCYTEWPQSEYVQRMLEADFELRPQDPRQACRLFREAEKRNVLPEEGYRLLRGKYYDVMLADYKKAPLEHLPDILALLDEVAMNQRIVNERAARRELPVKYCMYRLDQNCGVVTQILQPLKPDSPDIRQILDRARLVIDMASRCDNLAAANVQGVLNALAACRTKDLQPAGWIPIYSRLLEKLPQNDPKRLTSFLTFAQWAQGLAHSEAFYERPSAELERASLAAYRMLLIEYPEAPEVKLVFYGLCDLYQQPGREDDMARLLQIAAKSKSVTIKEWLADYYYTLGTREGYQKALAVLSQLTTQQIQHPLRPTWLYRLGRCYEYLGSPAEAAIAYRELIDGYPKTSCAVAAGWAIASLKGAQP